MNEILIAVIAVALILLFLYAQRRASATKDTIDLECMWHVPEDALEDFGLTAFILSKDYLYIQNESGGIVFDSPVTCRVSGSQLKIKDCHLFQMPLTIKSAAEDGLEGVYVFGEDKELVAYLEQLD